MPKVHIKGEGGVILAKIAFDIQRLELEIGRAEDNDVILFDEPSVSAHHCTIKRVYGGYVLKDLGSSNGTFINGNKEDKVLLEKELHFHVGNVPFTFLYDEDEIAQLAKEEQNPRTYVTQDKLPELLGLKHGAPIPTKKKKKLAADEVDAEMPVLVRPNLSATPGNQTLNIPQPTVVKSAKGPNPFFAVASLIIAMILGLGGGLFLSHFQETKGNLIEDFQHGKVVLKALDQPISE